MTNIDHLTDLNFDMATVMCPKDTGADDDLLTHLIHKEQNQI